MALSADGGIGRRASRRNEVFFDSQKKARNERGMLSKK